MDLVLAIPLSTIVILAAIQDLRVQKIPNLLTYPSMGLALIYHAVTNGLDGLLMSATGLALGIGLLILPYVMGGMGAGDAKLMGAVGAVVGPLGVFTAFLLTAIVGGVYALLILLIRREDCRGFIDRNVMTLKTFVLTRQFVRIPASEAERKPKLCYGTAIALGTILYISLELSGYNPVS
jgi:prepilin peptidase CpaA